MTAMTSSFSSWRSPPRSPPRPPPGPAWLSFRTSSPPCSPRFELLSQNFVNISKHLKTSQNISTHLKTSQLLSKARGRGTFCAVDLPDVATRFVVLCHDDHYDHEKIIIISMRFFFLFAKRLAQDWWQYCRQLIERASKDLQLKRPRLRDTLIKNIQNRIE